MEEEHGVRRTDILAGNHDLALKAINGDEPMMTSLVALCAAVLYGWDDHAMLEEISKCENDMGELFGTPIGWYATAAWHLLTGEEYEGDNDAIKGIMSDRMGYFKKGQVVQ
ncbi:MAG: hypothetical protein SOI38_05010 [Eggerthellaceae bacterium]